jgi:hypothetical protein
MKKFNLWIYWIAIGLSGNSGVVGVGRVRGRAQQEPGGKGIEGDQEVMRRKAD